MMGLIFIQSLKIKQLPASGFKPQAQEKPQASRLKLHA
jgi:hypothetical protein